MKQLKWISIFIAAIMLTGVVGCASTSTEKSAGQHIDDSVITAKVKSAFIADPELKATEINVETFKGTVQLSGFVGEQKDISKAVEVARGINGVTSVKNDIRLK
jgi:osmotically-inducible protein OsmY